MPTGMELFPDTSIITANSKLHQKMIHFDKCLKKKKRSPLIEII